MSGCMFARCKRMGTPEMDPMSARSLHARVLLGSYFQRVRNKRALGFECFAVGDSRAVLSRRGRAVDLSSEHRPYARCLFENADTVALLNMHDVDVNRQHESMCYCSVPSRFVFALWVLFSAI